MLFITCQTMSYYSTLSFVIRSRAPLTFSSFFFNDTATTEIYTLSLHDALPIYSISTNARLNSCCASIASSATSRKARDAGTRSEEHTSELQSHLNLVCRLLLEKKKTRRNHPCK